ncbi:hypothetical protein GOP47_0029295 [Adiantum capillus-veneris]|nr:hypothetical protein GOP47_0029295 [Adiantum capillus-veneris]
MERRQKLRCGICIVVGFFGLLATTLAIAAEIKHVKADEVVILGDDCFYPSSPAWALGVFAALSLLIAQIVAAACGGCICCCKKQRSTLSQTAKITAILCLVLSWIAFLNAFFLLLEGAALNGQQQLKGQLGMIHSCYILKPGVFGAGAGLSIFTCALAILYYVMATSSVPSSPSSSPTLRIAHHISAHHHHVGAFNPDYSFTSARLPYVSGLELPERYNHD